MPWHNDLKDVALDAAAAVVGKVSLHTADPGSTGANEVTGGSPAYARKAAAWAAASGGSVALSADVGPFDVPGSTTITHVGLWSADDLTFYGGFDVTDEAFGAQGTYTLTSGTLSLS